MLAETESSSSWLSAATSRGETTSGSEQRNASVVLRLGDEGTAISVLRRRLDLASPGLADRLAENGAIDVAALGVTAEGLEGVVEFLKAGIVRAVRPSTFLHRFHAARKLGLETLEEGLSVELLRTLEGATAEASRMLLPGLQAAFLIPASLVTRCHVVARATEPRLRPALLAAFKDLPLAAAAAVLRAPGIAAGGTEAVGLGLAWIANTAAPEHRRHFPALHIIDALPIAKLEPSDVSEVVESLEDPLTCAHVPAFVREAVLSRLALAALDRELPAQCPPSESTVIRALAAAVSEDDPVSLVAANGPSKPRCNAVHSETTAASSSVLFPGNESAGTGVGFRFRFGEDHSFDRADAVESFAMPSFSNSSSFVNSWTDTTDVGVLDSCRLHRVGKLEQLENEEEEEWHIGSVPRPALPCAVHPAASVPF